VWDGLVLALIFFWMTGLLADLQRSDVLAMEKFLHLPVSLVGALLVNYLSSWFSLSLLVCVPPMLGLAIGLAITHGPAMLLVLPAIVALLIMVTAVTFQFRGWLAALMVNKRRRQTILLVVTMSFVLFAQVPNLVMQYVRPDPIDPNLQHLLNTQAE